MSNIIIYGNDIRLELSKKIEDIYGEKSANLVIDLLEKCCILILAAVQLAEDILYVVGLPTGSTVFNLSRPPGRPLTSYGCAGGRLFNFRR